MKYIFNTAVVLSLTVCCSCIVVVGSESDDDGREPVAASGTPDEDCDEVPHDHRAERCDTYEGRDCCEWYIGEDCYETQCFYFHNCEWRWVHTRCEMQ